MPQVVRTYYPNNEETDRAAKRARAIREAAGTLSGVALGENEGVLQRDVLADVLEAAAGASSILWQRGHAEGVNSCPRPHS